MDDNGNRRYIIELVLREGLSHRAAAKLTGKSKAWVTKVVTQYRQRGEPALMPLSTRPHSCKHQISDQLQRAILDLRQELHSAGHDCGPQTIWHHLKRHHDDVPSLSTIWRVLKRHDKVVPQPHKRPKCSFVRFEASLPNQMWQTDFTHWHLAGGQDVEILNFLDDHSRLLTACTVFNRVKGADVVQTFYNACNDWGFPASLLSDNGAVFTGKSRKGKIFLESELERLGILFKHSRPYHPQTCGKVERFHQTLKRYLKKQPAAPTLAELQQQLDTFRDYYNRHRPHRALHGNSPTSAYEARVKALPQSPVPTAHFRVRQDKVGSEGNVTLRYMDQLLHIGVGRAFKHQRIRLLVHDKYVRIITEEGELIRDLTIDPTHNYQPIHPRQSEPQIGHHVLRQTGTMS